MNSAARLHPLAKMCVNMYVGELNTARKQECSRPSSFVNQGLTVALRPGEGPATRINTVAGGGTARPFNGSDAAHNGK
jgi:hypothetical protein